MSSFWPEGVNRAPQRTAFLFINEPLSDRMNHRQSPMIQGDVTENYKNK